MPFGTMRYSSNFDEATSGRPSASMTTSPVWKSNSDGLGLSLSCAAAGAAAAGGCANAGGLRKNRPDARSTVSRVALVMTLSPEHDARRRVGAVDGLVTVRAAAAQDTRADDCLRVRDPLGRRRRDERSADRVVLVVE